MNFQLLVNPFVELNFTEEAYKTRVMKENENGLIVKIKKNDLTAMLNAGMECRIDCVESAKRNFLIQDIKQERNWMVLRCVCVADAESPHTS